MGDTVQTLGSYNNSYTPYLISRMPIGVTIYRIYTGLDVFFFY